MEKPFEFSSLGDSFTLSPETLCTRNTLNESYTVSPETLCTRNTLNESYTISKNCYEDKTLTVICEENSECFNSSNMTFHKSFVSITDLNGGKNIPFADLSTKQISASPEFKLEIDDNIDEYYDSDESLGLLPDLLDLTSDSFILKDDLHKNLNTTGNISDKLIGNFKDCINYDVKYEEEFLSPIPNKINISDTQPESPVYNNQCMSVHASTPKQEISNIIDEEITSPQNISNFDLNEIAQDHGEEDCLNKTTIIETDLNSIITNIPISTCLNSDKNINSQQNILNTTCIMTKPENTEEMSLNKTFENLPALADKYVLPSIAYDSEQYKISKPNILDKTFEYHSSAEFDPSLGKENILNLTCHLDRESDAIGTICGKLSGNPKDDTREILNTTVSFPSLHDETHFTCISSKIKFDINVDQSNFQSRTGDVLNTTYENIEESLKYDANSEKLKCITNLENKLLQLGTKTVIKKRRTLSFSVKNVGPERFGFENKITEFDRNKNTRKSFSCFGKTATRSNLIKQTGRISVAGSTCSGTKVPEIKKPLSKNVPKHAGNIDNKCSLIYEKNEGNMNSSYLKNKTVECMPLKLSDRKSKTESVSKIKPRSSQQLLNTPISFHPTSDVDETVKCSSKFSNDKLEDIKFVSEVNLKDSQESLLNTTINLSPPITDAFKTVVKKPKKPMKINNAIESCLDSREDNKSVIPSIQKRGAIKVPQIRVKEKTQEFNKDETLTLSKRIGFKKSNSMEEKKISRLPQRALSQKTKFQSCYQSSSFKPSSNIAKPQTTAGIKPPNTKRKSFFTLTKPSNEETELAGKAISSDTMPSKKNKEQDTKISGIRPPTTSMKSTLIKSSNKGTQLAGKAISKDNVPSKKNKEQGTETCKKFQSGSRIPSISHFYQQGKTSLPSEKIGATPCKKSQLNLI